MRRIRKNVVRPKNSHGLKARAFKIKKAPTNTRIFSNKFLSNLMFVIAAGAAYKSFQPMSEKTSITQTPQKVRLVKRVEALPKPKLISQATKPQPKLQALNQALIAKAEIKARESFDSKFFAINTNAFARDSIYMAEDGLRESYELSRQIVNLSRKTKIKKIKLAFKQSLSEMNSDRAYVIKKHIEKLVQNWTNTDFEIELVDLSNQNKIPLLDYTPVINGNFVIHIETQGSEA